MCKATLPKIVLLPYLPLSHGYKIGEWILVPIDDFNGSWLDKTFETNVGKLAQRFVDAHGSRIKRVTILVHEKRGADGTIPTVEEAAALQIAIDVASIDHAMTLGGDPTMRLLTTDNTELQIWPIDKDGYIAYTAGKMVSTTSGGWNINHPNWVVPCPMELYMPQVLSSIDALLGQALYDMALQAVSTNNEQELRLITAIRWWSKAWRNSVSVTWEDRVVLLKTSFEALLDTSSTPDAATKLRLLFEQGEKNAGEAITNFLWKKHEGASRQHPYTGKKYAGVMVTDLEHWFLKFGEQRNNIIHQGSGLGPEYNETGSAYNGRYVWTAERVLREAVKMELEGLGFTGLWRTGLARRIHEACQQFEADQQESEQKAKAISELMQILSNRTRSDSGSQS